MTRYTLGALSTNRLRHHVPVAGFLIGAVAFGGAVRAVAADVIHVGPGTVSPFSEIQTAIDHATDGDTVRVGAGEYVIAEPLTFRGKRITVESEDGPEHTTIRMSEEPREPLRATVVVFTSGEDEFAVLRGFTLTGGHGFGSRGRFGGGVYCGEGTSPTLVDCTVTGNRAVAGGGVHAALGSSPTLVNCRILRNVAERGGGIFAASNFPTDRVAPDPEDPKSGAAPTLVDCRISQNWARSHGGGAFFDEQSSPTLKGSFLTGNSALLSGGGVFAYYSLASLAGSTIAGNASDLRGGGLYIRGETRPS